MRRESPNLTANSPTSLYQCHFSDLGRRNIPARLVDPFFARAVMSSSPNLFSPSARCASEGEQRHFVWGRSRGLGDKRGSA